MSLNKGWGGDAVTKNITAYYSLIYSGITFYNILVPNSSSSSEKQTFDKQKSPRFLDGIWKRPRPDAAKVWFSSPDTVVKWPVQRNLWVLHTLLHH